MLPVPGVLAFPEPSDDQNPLINDSTSSCASSSLRVLSESDSEQEQVQEVGLCRVSLLNLPLGRCLTSIPPFQSAKPLTTEKISEAEPASSSLQASLRDRRSRRLTAKYAEALEEQMRRRRQRENDSGTLGSPTVALSVGEEDEENQNRLEERPFQIGRDSQTVKSLKRPRPGNSPDKIIEGKRKPKANVSVESIIAVVIYCFTSL